MSEFQSFTAGTCVELQGLVTETHLNGRTGIVCGRKSDRITVELESENECREKCSVKPCNLRLLLEEEEKISPLLAKMRELVLSGTNKYCAACGAFEEAQRLLKCSRCASEHYCSKKCQREHWVLHKEHCDATVELLSMGTTEELERKNREQQQIAYSKQLKKVKKSGTTIVCVSITSFGLVAPGLPIPDGVPPNFALKQAAKMEAEKVLIKGLGNTKGERAYRDYYDDIVNNREQWLAFFDDRGNHEHAEHTCGILGILATIYRQRGWLEDCEKVLDMELEVLTRYEKSSVGSPKGQVHCCDTLFHKYRIIRYNLYFQTERYDECVDLYRKFCEYEFKYKLSYEEQMYLFMVVEVLHKKISEANIRSLTDAEVKKMVMYPITIGHGTRYLDIEGKKKLVALHDCANCARTEDSFNSFPICKQCRSVYYCGRECQNKHWKSHKTMCRASAQ